MSLKFQKNVTNIDIDKKIKFDLHHEIIEYLLYFLKVFVGVALSFIVIKTSIFSHFTVSGASMYPTYKDQELVYVNKFTPNFSDYSRGDVVVVKRPSSDCDGVEACYFIKRVVGVPGDSIILENGDLYIKNRFYPESFKLNEEEYLSEDTKTFKERYSALGVEKVEEGSLGKDEYYVLGDNRGSSKDSRYFGKIQKEDIEGKVFYHAGVGFTELPAYQS